LKVFIPKKETIMNQFLALTVFQAVVETGSFVKASELLGMSKPVVTRNIQMLEANMGVKLLYRTTRRLSLTDEGQLLYERGKNILIDLQTLTSELSDKQHQLTGTLRINVPVTFGVRHLSHLWGKFMMQNPSLSLEVTLSDRLVDLVEDGVDMAIRISQLKSSNLVSKRLASTEMLVCASPSYLKKNGIPLIPKDIINHQVIGYAYWFTKNDWQFTSTTGATETIKTQPKCITNNGDTCLALAIEGQGLIMQPRFVLEDALNQGLLVTLLPEYHIMSLGIYAVYPSKQHLPLKVRRLIDFLSKELSFITTKHTQA